MAINGHIAAIATSAREQTTGLAEINTAVNQMDQVTQQNAAMVEEATAAMHQLSASAQKLTNMIGRFDVGATNAAGHAPAQTSRAA